ncbi:DUF927 domain-containing protein [Marinovum sp.]|uniref:DUF927 domain-containing protein n=1 Tax=Marinovum sp. TaxID=2024839 RepID=UPI003A94EB53
MHQQSLALKVTETFVEPSTAANATWKPEAGLADGFLVKEEGIYKHDGDPSEDSEPQRICSPLRVLGQCRDPQGKGWGSVISVQDADGRWHECVVEARLVQKRASAALDPLFALGLQLGDVEKADKAVIGMIASWRTEHRYERTDRLGWLGDGFDAFALGRSRVIGTQKIIHTGASQAMDRALKPRGTMEQWRRDVAEPCAGNPLMVLALSTAFSGPLLSMLGAEGGGFHFRGPSSCGKSTLLRIAVSVWGAPDFKQSWRGTDNGIEGIAAASNNTLLALDELHEVEPKVAGEIVYMLANGRGKARMDRGRQADARQRWSVPVLSSGELSLEAHMQSARRKATAGQEVRLIDLAGGERRFGAFDTLHGSTSGQVFADRMQEATAMSHGMAGAKFVEYLIANHWKAGKWQPIVDEFCQICVRNLDLPPDGQVCEQACNFDPVTG